MGNTVNIGENKSQKIIFVIRYFHPYIGGLEKQTLRLAQALIKRGMSVEVVTSRFFSDWQKQEMINGVSVIASDLPGVRQPVCMTGQGKVIPAGDSRALAESICDIVSRNIARSGEIHQYAAKLHNPDHIATQYEALFRLLIQEKDSA